VDQETLKPRSLAESHDLWRAAERAVARAWTSDDLAETELPYAGRFPDRFGRTPPGLVFSNSESPMLAGAVALAAGRFQPLIWLDGVPSSPGSGDKFRPGPEIKPFHAVLSLSEARRLARMIESRAAAIASPHSGLGDRCDFLTMAVDWPYRYQNDLEEGIARGEHALDDLIGRVLETEEGGLATSRSRWAFTGRLLGDPASSVYRAMCALFLHPDESLLWDTYTGAGAWTEYRMTEAAAVLGQLWPEVARPLHRAGAEANVAAWHQALDPVSRFGWIMVNSSGGPRQFAISGGGGVPADLPRGRPAAVSMIQSFSAADPLDSSTIAGRWLANGAYVYFGSMNEPYLDAFRTPRLVTELAAAEIPLSAVLRQGESERFGRPWRLVYLGDPLYHFPSLKAQSRQNRAAPKSWRGGSSAPVAGSAEVITAGLVHVDPSADPAARLQGCLTAAMAGLCQPDPGQGGDGRSSEAQNDVSTWPSVLTAIDRQTLAPAIRPVLDELVIDTLFCRGEQTRLLDWLGIIPPAEWRPRVRDAFETTAMSRLSALSRDRSATPILDFWEQMLERPRPVSSGFPAQLTARLAAVVESDPVRYREPYQKRLMQAAAALAAKPEQSPQAAIIGSELSRLKITIQPAAGSP
jgi:hypothetical protein